MLERLYYELSIAAARQLGLVTRAQVARLSDDNAAIDRLCEAKLLQVLDTDVFQLPSSSVARRYTYPFAAWLALAPDRFRWERPQAPTDDAVLSHESAAGLHGLGVLALPRTVFTAPQQFPAPQAVIVHVDRLAPEDITVVEGVPVTTPRRTILDLVRNGVDHEDVGRVLDDGLRLDVVDLRAVYDEMVPLATEFGFPAGGAAFLRYFLPDVTPASLSPRNLRAYAELAAPEEVAGVHARLVGLLDGFGAPNGVVDALSRDVAEEIVGRLRWG
ncbi:MULTISPECIES: hypothetical protein [unclassified Nocardia]|uniref:hypothetical protein n=1 Tax=unclassified Nocardia TaxID=2637762 RepID=UPI001CE42CC3|nr:MULTISPECIES: hypothetical protein [unclassified Nocardia]